MLSRYFISFHLAALITFGLFFAMQNLISSNDIVLSEPKARIKIEFGDVRKIIEPNDEITQPSLPEIVVPPEVTTTVANDGFDASSNANEFDLGKEIIVKPDFGTGVPFLTEGDFTAILMPAPRYPSALAEKGIEGFVRVKYSITKLGTTEDVVVVSSSNRGFERNAVRAAEKFKFKPKVEDGKAVLVQDVYNMIEFKLQN